MLLRMLVIGMFIGSMVTLFALTLHIHTRHAYDGTWSQKFEHGFNNFPMKGK